MQMTNSPLAGSRLPAWTSRSSKASLQIPPTGPDTKLPLISLQPWEALVREGGSSSSTCLKRTTTAKEELHHCANLANF